MSGSIELKPAPRVSSSGESLKSSGGGSNGVVKTVSQEYHVRDKKEMKEFGKIQQLKVFFPSAWLLLVMLILVPVYRDDSVFSPW